MGKQTLITREHNGYLEYFDPKTEQWKSTHRRVLEKRLGSKMLKGKHVHHIDEDKTNNRPWNLVPLTPTVHAIIHKRDPDACFRCGRSGHWKSSCTYKRDASGNPIKDDKT